MFAQLHKFRFRSERNTTNDKQVFLDENELDTTGTGAVTQEPYHLLNSAAGLISDTTLRSQSISHQSFSTNATTTSRLSGEARQVAASEHAASDPNGLQLVSDAAHRKGDLIFVHGLGGSAWKTWSWNRNINNFWPIWLAQRDDFTSWRIFTFGYNSKWKGGGTNLNISDFAKDLLLQMLTFTTEDASTKAAIGTAPIIFVAHSMGGLVVKKAFLLGKQDVQFAELVSKVYGIMFLGTPHRGSQLATTLNSILSSSPIGPPPKTYIADIQVQSNTLQEINEQFRHCYHDLEIVSFFETKKTKLGMVKSLVNFLKLFLADCTCTKLLIVISSSKKIPPFSNILERSLVPSRPIITHYASSAILRIRIMLLSEIHYATG